MLPAESRTGGVLGTTQANAHPEEAPAETMSRDIASNPRGVSMPQSDVGLNRVRGGVAVADAGKIDELGAWWIG